MVRLIKRDRGNYTNTCNEVIRDSRLTWKARGIFNYLWSQADKWQFYVAEVAQHAKDGVKSTRNGLDELAKQVIKDKDNSVNAKIAIKSISAIYEFSKGLLKDRDKEKAKQEAQDAEDQKIREIVDGKEKSTKKESKDPFAKLGE